MAHQVPGSNSSSYHLGSFQLSYQISNLSCEEYA